MEPDVACARGADGVEVIIDRRHGGNPYRARGLAGDRTGESSRSHVPWVDRLIGYGYQ